jgi:hypothetical protein
MHQAAIQSFRLIGDELKPKSLGREPNITSIQERESETPNLHEPEEPIHPAGKSMKH